MESKQKARVCVSYIIYSMYLTLFVIYVDNTKYTGEMDEILSFFKYGIKL